MIHTLTKNEMLLLTILISAKKRENLAFIKWNLIFSLSLVVVEGSYIPYTFYNEYYSTMWQAYDTLERMAMESKLQK